MPSTRHIKKPHRISTKAKLRLHYYRILLETSNFVDKFRKEKLPIDSDDNGLYRDPKEETTQPSKRTPRRNTSPPVEKKTRNEGTRRKGHDHVKSPLFSSSPTSSVDQVVRKGRVKLCPSQSADEFYQFQYERMNKSYADMYLGPSHSQILASSCKNNMITLEEQEEICLPLPHKVRVRAVSSDESIFHRQKKTDARQRRRRSSRTTRQSASHVEETSCKDVGGDRRNNDSLIGREKAENNGDGETTYPQKSASIHQEEIIRADSDHGKIRISRHRIHLRAENAENNNDDDDADRGWTVETKTMEIIQVETSEESPSSTRDEEKDLALVQSDEKVDQTKGPAEKRAAAKKLAKQVRLQGLRRRKQVIKKSMTDSLSAIKSTIHALTHRRRDPSAYNIKSYPLRFGLSVVDPRRKAAAPSTSSSSLIPLFDPISGRRLKLKKGDDSSMLTKIFDVMSPKKGNNYNHAQTKSHPYNVTKLNNSNNNTPETNVVRKTLSEIYQQSGNNNEKMTRSYYHDSASDDDDDKIREYYYKPQSPMTEKYAELLRK